MDVFQRVKSEGVMANGVMLNPPKECDLFDMSKMSESLDEEQEPSNKNTAGAKVKSEKKNDGKEIVMAPPKQVDLFDLTKRTRFCGEPRRTMPGRRAKMSRGGKQKSKVTVKCEATKTASGAVVFDLTASSDEES